jgi:hypothetical protein
MAGGGIASPPSDPLIGAAHLGAAELVEPEGIAAKVITRAGLTAEQVYSALGAGPATPVPDVTADTLSELAFDETGVTTARNQPTARCSGRALPRVLRAGGALRFDLGTLSRKVSFEKITRAREGCRGAKTA